ncbi:hypothetical protein HWV62_11616 [Athelia sp. TMB]|nr:hypothetical protein HWV62_11616 [Athelia sp. TMB]
MPCIALMGALTAPWGVHWKKSWSRIVTIRLLRYLFDTTSATQLQWYLGTSVANYTRWAEKHGYQSAIDDIGEGARLLWVGEKRYDRVILYIPGKPTLGVGLTDTDARYQGGGFVYPIYDQLIDFVRRLQSEVGRGTSPVGMVILDYGLAPYVNFPTPLRQANTALSHLFSLGVSPQCLQIIADSAGAHITLQGLSHALHPQILDAIPRSPLAPMLDNPRSMPRLKGIYLLAPYTYHDAAHQSACFKENDGRDFASAAQYWYWGSRMPCLPREQHPFIEAAAAPLDWFDGADRVVERMLVTAGEYELLRDHIIDFCRVHLQKFKALTFILVEEGVHGDPILTIGQPEGAKATEKIVAWLKEGFE